MKRAKRELEVDSMGGAAPLTKEEEKMISDFIQSRKQKAAVKKRSTPTAKTATKRIHATQKTQ